MRLAAVLADESPEYRSLWPNFASSFSSKNRNSCASFATNLHLQKKQCDADFNQRRIGITLILR
jgi:hypothetical protein